MHDRQTYGLEWSRDLDQNFDRNLDRNFDRNLEQDWDHFEDIENYEEPIQYVHFPNGYIELNKYTFERMVEFEQKIKEKNRKEIDKKEKERKLKEKEIAEKMKQQIYSHLYKMPSIDEFIEYDDMQNKLVKCKEKQIAEYSEQIKLVIKIIELCKWFM